MALIIVGLNHKSAPLEVLEKAIIPKHKINDALCDMMRLPAVDAAVILTTCNRCEIYADIKSAEELSVITEWFIDFSGMAADIFQKHACTFTNRDAVQHLMRVACSLESMIVGESQILGQVKEAYQTAQTAKATNKHLARLFENVLSTAKHVRNKTDIAKHPLSFSSTAVKISKKLFENLENKYALMIGTGEMIQLTTQHFKDNGLKQITISGRSPNKMREIAIQFDGETLPLEQINQHLSNFDIVISATASESVILTKSAVGQALKKRRHKPMYMVDLALPHDIENSIGEFEDVYLYTLETLAQIINQNRNLRLGAAIQAGEIIQSKTDEYFDWINSDRAIEVINRLRNEADLNREEALQKALKQLRSGKNPEEVLAFLATALTNKLVHKPTQLIKNVATAEDYTLLQVIERFLDQ